MKLVLFRYEPDDDDDTVYDINAAKDPKLFRLLRGEDPVDDATEMNVPCFSYFITDKLFQDLGRAIANSPTLTSLEVVGSEVEEHFSIHGQFYYELRFLKYVNRNRTLQHLLLRDIHGDEAIERLNVFLKENDNLQSFEMFESFSFSTIAITHFKLSLCCRKNPLKRVAFGGCRIRNDMIKDIVSFFTTYPILTPQSISLVEGQIGDEGCSILSEVIRNTSINLEEIELLGNEMTTNGFQCIAAALTCRTRPLKRLSIGIYHEHDRALDSEVIAFLVKFSSKSELLPDKLILGGNHIGREGLKQLGTFLSNRVSSLEMLELNFVYFLSGGLRAFFEGLQNNPQNAPKHLNFADTNLYDEDYLNPTMVISEFLLRSNCSVERIFIENQEFQLDDEKLEIFVNVLNTNHTLKELAVDEDGTITSIGWNKLSSVLCNATSISATRASNHTIIRFGRNPNQQPDKIRYFLEMNTNPDKQMVGRMKVIHACFARDFDVGQFVDVPPGCLAEFLPRMYKAFEELADHGIPLDFGENSYEGRRENNSLTIHHLILKNNLAIFDSVIPRDIERARLEE